MTVDRFEGSVAVVDLDGAMFDLPRWMVPEDAKEGSILVGTATGGAMQSEINLRVDTEATAAARAQARAALSQLRRSDSGGDIAL